MVRRPNRYALDFQNRVRVRAERRVNLRFRGRVGETGTDFFEQSWLGYGEFGREVRNLYFLAFFFSKIEDE